MYELGHIKSYIIYLKEKCGLSVTLHPIGDEKLIIPSELITFNIHDNPYCVYVKSSPEARRHCVARQRKVFEKARLGSFCGNCYAGVREYVYPVRHEGLLTCFICVSGYACEGAESYIERTAQSYALSRDGLTDAYAALKREMPPQSEIDTLILPLCAMLELAYIKNAESTPVKATLFDSVERYIKQFRCDPISLDDICRHFSCSRSYISHGFKAYTGLTVREYLTRARIEDAKTLLLHSKLTVTEIAFSVGFCDSNYFSNVFKKKVGVTPLSFRSASRTQ
ncbi:MAG: helix-turn-helix domain-containing protein [Clostridia bacterium]|nr:helix-turn-helix domain-containing protein [Clostridia bacterium]